MGRFVPKKPGADYTNDEIRETSVFNKTRAALVHLSCDEVLKISRKEISSQWDAIRKKKACSLTRKYLEQLAELGFRGTPHLTIKVQGIDDYAYIPNSDAPRRR